MKSKKVSLVLAGLFLGAACFSAAGCGTQSGTQSQETASEAGQREGVAEPILVTPAELDGATFTLTHEQDLVVTVPSDPAGWAGEVKQIDVAEFLAGNDNGGAKMNPGFEAVAPGTTKATLTSPDGQVYEFTLVVE